METIFERVKKIIATQLGVDEAKVTMKASFKDDLDADSLDLVELVMAFEEQFETDSKPFEIPDEDAEKLLTVKDVMDYLTEKGFSDD